MKELLEYILENRGHDFERRYEADFDKYKKLLEEAIKLNLSNATLTYIGNRNNKRSLIVNNRTIKISDTGENSGNNISDFQINNNGEIINLSLKYGRTVTYLNCGMAQYINGFEPIGNGEYLFDFFGIDKAEFKNTFDVYKKQNKDSKTISVIKEIDKDKILEFLRQVLGYNYILIHEIGNTVEHYDLREEDQCKKFIGDKINNAEVIYPQGKGKYVKVVIELDNRICNIIFRNKKGGIEPKEMLITFREK